MTALLLANIKLVLLFALVGAIVGLSTAGQRHAPRIAATRQVRRTAAIKVPT